MEKEVVITSKTKDQIKAFFQTGDKPTEAQFIDFIDSYTDRSGPIGNLEAECSSLGSGPVIVNSGTPTITTYAALKASLGLTVSTTAEVATAIPYASTAQAAAGAAQSVVMDPVLTKNAIQALAFTSASFSTTAQAVAGTDNTSIMTPVLTKNAIETLASQAAGLTIIESGSFTATTLKDITSIPATYRALRLYIFGASNTVATRALTVQVATGGALGNSAATGCAYHQIAGTTITAQVNGALQLWTNVTQTAAQTSSCIIDFPAYQSGPVKKYDGIAYLGASSGAEFSTGTQTTVWGVLTDAGGVPRTGAIDKIRITWDNVATGVFDGGTYALYGVN